MNDKERQEVRDRLAQLVESREGLQRRIEEDRGNVAAHNGGIAELERLLAIDEELPANGGDDECLAGDRAR
jgi:hypothetical protein